MVESLEAKGFPILDMTDNELAKEHMRYMVGGHAPCLLNEVVYRIQFPERPGRCCSFFHHWAGAGTSACSTTGTTGQLSGRC